MREIKISSYWQQFRPWLNRKLSNVKNNRQFDISDIMIYVCPQLTMPWGDPFSLDLFWREFVWKSTNYPEVRTYSSNAQHYCSHCAISFPYKPGRKRDLYIDHLYENVGGPLLRLTHLTEFQRGWLSTNAVSCVYDPALPPSGLLTMADNLQTTFSNEFSWMKLLYINFDSTEICSRGSSWYYVNIGSGNGLAPVWRQAITWTNVDQINDNELIFACSPGRCGSNIKSQILKFVSRIDILSIICKTSSGRCHKTSLMISQRWFR